MNLAPTVRKQTSRELESDNPGPKNHEKTMNDPTKINGKMDKSIKISCFGVRKAWPEDDDLSYRLHQMGYETAMCIVSRKPMNKFLVGRF